MKIKKPEKLYIYCPFNAEKLGILVNSKVWASSADKFNDPFDMAIEIRLPETIKDCLIVLKAGLDLPKVVDKIRDNLEKEIALIAESGSFTERTKGLCKSVQESHIQINIERMGVVCFSASKESMLMWSHYADGHKGFVIEFETNSSLFKHLFKVCYPKELPNIPMAQFISEGMKGINTSSNLLVTSKFKGWSYEKEYRMIYTKPNHLYDLPGRISAVYAGTKMKQSHLLTLANTILEKDIQLFQSHKSRQHYSLDFYSRNKQKILDEHKDPDGDDHLYTPAE